MASLLAACDIGSTTPRLPPTRTGEQTAADLAKPTVQTIVSAKPTEAPTPTTAPARPTQAAKPTASAPAPAKPAEPGISAKSPSEGRTTTGPLGAGSRIPWLGQSWNFNGANVPWLNWQRDFGGGQKDGISHPDNRKTLSTGLGNAKANGVNVIRWWVFEGDAWQIKRDDGGAPSEIDEAVFADFDAALEMAEEHDLYYVFVLFSAPSHLPASWLEDPGQRSSLASALSVLFANYRNHPRVMTWEVFNEPEFDVWEKRAKEEAVKATIKEIADAIHANSHAYATVGGAMLDGLPMMKGLGLDYYQAHWYDYMGSGDWCVICHTYEDVRKRWSLDAPLVIGELYLSVELENPHLRMEDLYTKGYAGAWPWSIFPDATQDKLAIDWTSMRIFAGRHPDLGPRLTNALPPSNAAPTQRLSFRSTAQVGGPRSDVPRFGPNQRVPIDVRVTGTVSVKVLVAIQVFHSGGQKVHEQVMDNQSFGPGESKPYSTFWTVPATAATGDYVVKVGVFTAGWGKMYDWNDEAGKFTVAR